MEIVFADVTKLKYSYIALGWTPNNDCALIKGENTQKDKDTQRRRPGEDRGGDQSDTATNRGMRVGTRS